jgi:tRNA threonylcarbamoyladenosine biosynthesis protein TsaB
MMLLGIETATTVCAAAVVRDGMLLAEELVDERNVHAERLMGMVDAAFRRSGSTLEQMAGIAVSIGPGSFTGLRIGLSVAKGLAFACGKPIVPVPTLQGMAEKAFDAIGDAGGIGCFLPLLDARRGDVYCALYRVAEGRLLPMWEQRIMTLTTVAEAVRGRQVFVTGDARHAFERLIQEQFQDIGQQVRIASDDIARCSAASVAHIGEQLLRQGMSADPGILEPQYLREFHTTTH